MQRQTTEIQVLEALRNARDYFDQSNIVYSSKKNGFTDPNTGFVFTSADDLLNSLHEFGIQGKTLKEAGFELEEWYELLKQQQETTTEIPEYKEQTTTVGDLDQLKNLQEQAEKRAQQKATIQAREKEAVARFKETGEKRYQDQQKAEALKEKQTQELLNQFFKNVGGKVVVIPVGEIPEVQLTKENKEILLATEIAAKEDPATTQKVFEEKIQLALNNSELEYKESIKEEEIKKSAAYLVETLRNLPDHKSVDEIPDNPKALNTLSIINPLSNPDSPEMILIIPDKESREEFAKKVQTLMLTSEAERVVNLAGARAIFGEGGESLIYSLYGPDTITDFKISNDEKDREEGVEIDPQAVYEKGEQIYNFINKVKQARTTEEVTSTALAYYPSYSYSGTSIATKTVSTLNKALPAVGVVYGFRQGTLLAHWAKYNTPLLTGGGTVPFLTAGGIQNTVLMSNGLSSKILFNKNFTTGYSVQVMQFAKGTNTLYTAGATFGNKAFGVYLGQAGGKVGAGTIAVKATGQVAVKALPAAVASKIGAFLGSAGGLVGTAVGFIGGELIGKLIEKINWPKVKKWFQENGPVLAGIAGLGGLALGGPAVGGLVLFGGLAATGSLTAFALGGARLLGLIGRSALITISTPVIVTLLILPPLVAFIMLVINNSAYVVPPSPYSSSLNGGADNPYMLVTKTANPTKLNNSSSNQTVIYVVSIKALKGNLTNLKLVSTECNVIKKDKSKVECPTEFVSDIDGASIAPGNDGVFSFTGIYGPKYSDSLIYDTITISATNEAGEEITTSGSASVCIGECPANCAVVSDNADAWPPNIRPKAEAGLGILSQYQGFTAKACPNNEVINLCYRPSQIDPDLYAWHVHNRFGDDCDVYFNDGPFKSNRDEADAAFMITHELTHHIQRLNGFHFVGYVASGSFWELKGNGLCTYPATIGSSIDIEAQQEAMAEAAALQVNSSPSWDSCATNYKALYPKNYLWSQDFMTK